ncbi:Uncharacterised protein [Vibrio cholerae]|uniref:Uncharacterized protein n=1 Tax=Vibrio cholerae TaxID=666 RepID=A0A655XRY4_VIBCL|nr:Uncharacterised protein [Vibrio cholerae]CSD59067.1 Uncharacterised protein [Vibrio cholerae]CSI29870.1 Uncharacterised protein [Vibrio cholerae]
MRKFFLDALLYPVFSHRIMLNNLLFHQNFIQLFGDSFDILLIAFDHCYHGWLTCTVAQ